MKTNRFLNTLKFALYYFITNINIFLYILITLAMLFIKNQNLYAEKISYLKSIRYNSNDNYTRIVFEFNTKTDFSKQQKGDTLIIKLSKTLPEKYLKIPKIFNLKLSFDKKYNTLIQINVKNYKYKIFKLEDPYRVVLDISNTELKDIDLNKINNKDETLLKVKYKKDLNISIDNIKTKEDDDLLRLYLSIFLQAKDLKNAHRVANKALKKYPSSIYWHEQMAKISLWIGELDDAYNSMIFIYKNSKNINKSLINQVYSLSIEKGDYATILHIIKYEVENGNIEQLNDYVYISTEILGDIDGTLEVLNNLLTKYPESKKSIVLKHILRIHYNQQNIDVGIQTLENYLRKNYPLDTEISSIASTLYFTKRDYLKSLNIMKQSIPYATDNNSDFWEQLSDLAEFMNDKNTAILASLKLYKYNKARDVDYERIINYTDEKDIKGKILLEAWLKFKKSYYAYQYLNFLIKENNTIDAKHFIEQNLQYLSNDISFMLLTANFYLINKDIDSTKKIYKKVLEISDLDTIKENFLWLLIDSKDKELPKYIDLWKNSLEKNPSLNLPYASYFSSIQKYKIAIYYLKNYINYKGENPTLLLLYADILQSAGLDESAMQIRFKAFKIFEESLKYNENYLKVKENIIALLTLTLNYKSGEEFISLYEKYSNNLSEKEKSELKILYYLKNDHQEYAKFLRRKYQYSQPWIDLNISLKFNDKADISDIIYTHISSLPIRDRVEAARTIGDLPLATDLAYKGLDEEYTNIGKIFPEQRSEDSELYKQYRDLINQYSNRFTFKDTIASSSDISYIKNDFSIKHHIVKGFYLDLEISHMSTSSKGEDKIKDVPKYTSDIKLKLTKKNNDISSINISTGTLESLKTNTSFGAGFEYYLKNNTILNVSYNHNIKTDENTLLMLGGMKNEFTLDLRYNLTNKNSLFGSYSFNQFYSQDKKSLGSSQHIYCEYDFKLREGYPDIIWKNFISYANYSSEECSECIIRKLSPYEQTNFLPSTFTEIGTGISIGETNIYGYTRVFRPFASFSLSYNTESNINYSLSGGIGGHIFNQDHLSFGLTYGTNSKNSADVNKSINIIYRLFY